MSSHFINLRLSFLVLALFLCASNLGFGVPVLDTSNDVGGSSSARELRPSNFWAQSVTVTSDGLLSQIDVQLGKFAGATGDVTFEIRPLVNGLPTVDDRDRLFVSTIDIDDVPVINSLADPPPFVSVDVTDAGIHAKAGDEYVISMRRSGGTPAAAWRSSPNTYAEGTGFFRNLLNVPWTPNVDDLGFQTWVDPDPTAPYKYVVQPTFDMTYIPGDISALIEGESSLLIGGIPGSDSFPEQRPILEFPLDDLPPNAIIQDARLLFDWGGSSGAPHIEVTGFKGDGLASFSDATTTGTIVATTGSTSASSPPEVPIDPNYVISLIGQASHLGIRMRSLDLPLYVTFNTLEAHSSISPAQLVIDYTFAQPGDFNLDGKVDGRDLSDPIYGWNARFGDDLSGINFLEWQRNLGSGVPPFVAAEAVPEPNALWLGALATLQLLKARQVLKRRAG